MTLLTAGADLEVTMVNPSTKKARRLVYAYIMSEKGDSIFKAYGSPSAKKVEAFNHIIKEMESVNGWGIRITGAGSNYFSCAYLVMGEDRKKYLIYHTHVNRYAISFNEV